jgi:hypothetical protein
MSNFDAYINSKLQSSQFAVGVSTVLVSALTKDLFPRLPKQALKILDLPIVHVLLLAFLITSQTKKPTMSVISAVAIVLLLHVLTKVYAPDTPPLSEILKPDDKDKKKDDEKRCVCECNPRIVLPEKHRYGSFA